MTDIIITIRYFKFISELNVKNRVQFIFYPEETEHVYLQCCDLYFWGPEVISWVYL